jgi:hypothetical protein
MNRREWSLAAASVLALSGCAGLRTVECEVTTFGTWPADRPRGTYAFERLPSQQAQGRDSDQLEAWARPALEAAGFRPVAAGTAPDVLVQLGARITRFERSPWDDPLWWRGGYGGWHVRPWGGPYWGLGRRYDAPRYEREVAILLRDRQTGEPMYEARASSDGFTIGVNAYIQALFAAALREFPAVKPSPHSVTVPLPP